MIVDKANLVSLARGFKTVFTNRLRNAPGTLMHSLMCTRMPSTLKTQDYNWLADSTGMTELLGTPEIQGLQLVNWSVTNKEFHETIGVKTRDIENDNLGVYNTRFEGMADNANQHPEELLAAALVAGFDTPDYTVTAAGVACNFFSSTSGRRLYKGASATLDNKVTGAFSATTFSSARKKLREMKNGAGKSMRLGRDLVLVVGPHWEETARKVLNAEMVAEGGVSVSNVNKGTARLEVWPEIAATTNSLAWFLFDAGAVYKPMVYQTEKETTMLSCTDPEDSYVLLKKEILNQAYGIYNVGYLFPQLIVGGTGS